MRFSDATGRKVVSTSTAETVGKVDEFVVDPKSHSVIALELKKTDEGDSLRWSDVAAFGTEAVTVSGADKITEAGEDVAALSGKKHHLMGKRVLSTEGDEMGKVEDVEFDPQTGEITALVLGDDHVEGVRLLGVGSYAVVVATR